MKLNKKEKNNNIINKPKFIDSETQIDLNMINPGYELQNKKFFINNIPKKNINNENEELLNEMTLLNSNQQNKQLINKYYFENLNENFSKNKNENNCEFDKFVLNKENIKKIKNKNYKINSYYFKLDGKFKNKNLSKQTNKN